MVELTSAYATVTVGRAALLSGKRFAPHAEMPVARYKGLAGAEPSSILLKFELLPGHLSIGRGVNASCDWVRPQDRPECKFGGLLEAGAAGLTLLLIGMGDVTIKDSALIYLLRVFEFLVDAHKNLAIRQVFLFEGSSFW